MRGFEKRKDKEKTKKKVIKGTTFPAYNRNIGLLFARPIHNLSAVLEWVSQRRLAKKRQYIHHHYA
jgi:hypothetical protein